MSNVKWKVKPQHEPWKFWIEPVKSREWESLILKCFYFPLFFPQLIDAVFMSSQPLYINQTATISMFSSTCLSFLKKNQFRVANCVTEYLHFLSRVESSAPFHSTTARSTISSFRVTKPCSFRATHVNSRNALKIHYFDGTSAGGGWKIGDISKCRSWRR